MNPVQAGEQGGRKISLTAPRIRFSAGEGGVVTPAKPTRPDSRPGISPHISPTWQLQSGQWSGHSSSQGKVASWPNVWAVAWLTLQSGPGGAARGFSSSAAAQGHKAAQVFVAMLVAGTPWLTEKVAATSK